MYFLFFSTIKLLCKSAASEYAVVVMCTQELRTERKKMSNHYDDILTILLLSLLLALAFVLCIKRTYRINLWKCTLYIYFNVLLLSRW